jgi:hypothetical protein
MAPDTDKDDLEAREKARLKGVASTPSFLKKDPPAAPGVPPPPPPQEVPQNQTVSPPSTPVGLPPSPPNLPPVALPPPPVGLPDLPVPLPSLGGAVADTFDEIALLIPKVPQKTPIDDNVLQYQPQDSFMKDLAIFFYQLQRANAVRYNMWEETIVNVLRILKKIELNVERNTEKMLITINQLHQRIIDGLEDFKRKRDEVVRYADVDFIQVTKNMRRTLQLLEMQIKEFRLRQMINELYVIYAN